MQLLQKLLAKLHYTCLKCRVSFVWERQSHTQPTICSDALLTVNYAAIAEYLNIIQLTGM